MKNLQGRSKRARHNSSLLDAHILKPKEDTEKMPDSYVIFITENDEIGKLMYDFSCIDPDDMNYEELAQKARYFKRDEKGVAAMCKMMEDMRKEAELKSARETAKRMIQKGKMTLEDIAGCVPILSFDELKEIEAEVLQLA